MANTGDLITRVYGAFRGVDFRGEEINLQRSPEALNVWKDYKETDSIRTRPGMELVYSHDDTVYGVFFYRKGEQEVCFAHVGDKLYLHTKTGKALTDQVLWQGLNRRKSYGFVYNNMWYFKDGVNFLRVDLTGNGFTAARVDYDGYVPTTSIGRKPLGGGTMYEDINLLSGERINTFVGDGASQAFHLDAQNIDTDYTLKVKVNDAEVTGFGVDYVKGIVTFPAAKIPPAPYTDGQDNVSIQFSKTIAGYKEKILNCTILELFDNRIFCSGNPDYPNTVWHCSLNDPTYWSDLDYYTEGLDSSPVTAMVAGNNALWVFREHSQTNTTVFYHTPTIDAEYGKIYPSTHSSIATGCIGGAVNFNDDIVFFSERGMEGVSGDVTTEQVIAHRSSLVDRKLVPEKNYRGMILAEWEGYLFVFIGNKAYLADSRGAFTNGNHIEYEWFYWELEHEVTSATVYDGMLFVGTESGIYSFTDMEAHMESYYVTPKDKCNAPHKLKTTNKRGCKAEAEGDISVYVKTEKTEFEYIGTYTDVEDYFVSRIKRKKWKDIQLKFYSNTRFVLEEVTLECFIGGYIKR